MPRIEELVVDSDETVPVAASQHLSNPQTTQLPLRPSEPPHSSHFSPPTKAPTENDTTRMAPALPPAMESVKSKSVDEVLEMMNRTPLFMTSLDETDGEGMSSRAADSSGLADSCGPD